MAATLPGLLAAYGSSSVLWTVLSTVVWFLVLIWIYNIAKRKGRHPVLWVLLGVFFSLITLIVILVLPSKYTTDAAGRG